MKAFFSKLWRGIYAGVTSTEAVKAEKSLLALILTRVLVSVGAGAGLAAIIKALLGG